ncbi:MAG: hypothetical protein ABIN91_13970 [Mucilaginibacter sp.]|uniref:hypothetical protein n=1 Tax=Mucilaginibacter sp. TaxID=1882438 RepID=UPI003263F7C9
MANQNPIQVGTPQVQTTFQIPATISGNHITLTVRINLNAPGWSYVISNQIYLDGNDIYPTGTPAPSKLLLDTGAALNGKQLMLLTKVTLIYAAGGVTTPPPVYTYTISIDDGATNLGTFTASSVSTYVTNFNSLLLFEQL